jgi:Arc/MetJ family transcription regulator
MKTTRYKTKTKAELKAASNAIIDRLEREGGAEGSGVRTNIVMEEPLIAEAQTITGIKTKTGVVHYALREVVRREKMKEALAMRGKVKFWDGYVDEHVKP